MDHSQRIEELDQEIRDMKSSFAEMIKLKDNQLQDLRAKLLEYEKICSSLERNIRLKDDEIARMRK